MRISPAALSRTRELAAQRLGLHFPAARDADLEQALQGAIERTRRRSVEEYLDAVAAGSELDPEWIRLSDALTVGETHFWRDRACVDELECRLLPALIHARRGEGRRVLRLWSAGCSTGEEPYTLAMLLDRLLPDREVWDVTLLATDLNARSIAAARAARYGDWSLRDIPGDVRERYFERRGKTFRLVARIRDAVRFERFNLMAGVPSAVASAPMDLILCRNVLMYLTPPAARAVVVRLRSAMAPHGRLIVAAVEASSEMFRPLKPVAFPGGLLFQRTDETDVGTVAPVIPREGSRAEEETRRLERRRAAHAALAVPAPPPRPALPLDLKSRARRLANGRRLDEALVLCREAIVTDRLDVDAYRLLAAIEQERGDSEAAVEALRRTLYLDPESADAHLSLGNLLIRAGERGRGLRHLQVAERLRQAGQVS